jgi:hypothetical protein
MEQEATSGSPVWLPVDGDPQQLERVGLSERLFDEDWIQRLLYENPALLPVVEIDETMVPLVPLSREVSTTAGAIDALFISPTGALTVVEAKLWRNPQARREVVGQIIDYAQALTKWTYEDLDALARREHDQSLWKLVADKGARTGESEFIDAVSLTLRIGRFLLLVVGDGIREGVASMASYLQQTPQLRFTLALVELRVFRSGDGSRLVVPSVVTRTSEVVRAVVDVKVAPEARVSVEVEVPRDDSTQSRGKLTQQQFFEELGTSVSPSLVEFARSVMETFDSLPRFRVTMQSASFVLSTESPDGKRPLTLLVFNRNGTVYPGWLDQQLGRQGIDAGIGERFVADLARILDTSVIENSPSFLVAVDIGVVRDRWASVRDRIDQFRSEVDAAAET